MLCVFVYACVYGPPDKRPLSDTTALAQVSAESRAPQANTFRGTVKRQHQWTPCRGSSYDVQIAFICTCLFAIASHWPPLSFHVRNKRSPFLRPPLVLVFFLLARPIPPCAESGSNSLASITRPRVEPTGLGEERDAHGGGVVQPVKSLPAARSGGLLLMANSSRAHTHPPRRR